MLVWFKRRVFLSLKFSIKYLYKISVRTYGNAMVFPLALKIQRLETYSPRHLAD